MTIKISLSKGSIIQLLNGAYENKEWDKVAGLSKVVSNMEKENIESYKIQIAK